MHPVPKRHGGRSLLIFKGIRGFRRCWHWVGWAKQAPGKMAWGFGHSAAVSAPQPLVGMRQAKRAHRSITGKVFGARQNPRRTTASMAQDKSIPPGQKYSSIIQVAVRPPLTPDRKQEKSKPYARIKPTSARGVGRLLIRWQRQPYGQGALFQYQIPAVFLTSTRPRTLPSWSWVCAPWSRSDR